MENKKVKFGELSLPLKIAVISAYIVGVLYALLFLVGFIGGTLALI